MGGSNERIVMLLKKAYPYLLMSLYLYPFCLTPFNLLFILLTGCLHQFFPTKHHLSCSITLALPMTQFVFLVVLVFPFSGPIIKISSNFALLNVSSLGLAPIIRVTFAFKRTLVMFTSLAMLCSMSCLFLFILPLLLLSHLQLTNLLLFLFLYLQLLFLLLLRLLFLIILYPPSLHPLLLSPLPHRTLRS